MANNGGGATRRSLFSTSDRQRLLEQALGEPTSVTVEIGGVTFDLVPFSFKDGSRVLELVQKLGGIFGQLKERSATDDQIATAIGSNGSEILATAKKVLQDSSFLEDDEQRALFEEWFDQLPMIPTIRTLAPAVFKANWPNLGNAPAPTAEVSTATSEPALPSESETSSVTS